MPPRRSPVGELRATFAHDDNVLLVLAPASGDVFTSRGLAALAELTERAWQLPGSVRVDSLVSALHDLPLFRPAQ